MAGDEWGCGAYGMEGLAIGAACFIAPPGERTCPSRRFCDTVMTVERHRVWTRMVELAHSGDRDSLYILSQFDGPDQLLRGDDEPPPQQHPNP